MDISPEIFIRQWKILSRWVDEEAESAKIYRRLEETAELHATDRADFYQEADLQVALKWREERQPKDVWAIRYHPKFNGAMKFLAESLKFREEKSLKKRSGRIANAFFRKSIR